MRIGYQGEPGAFSEAAARRVDPDAQLVPFRSFEEVFDAVNGGAARYGGLPNENSIGGSHYPHYEPPLSHEAPLLGQGRPPGRAHPLPPARPTLRRPQPAYSQPP